MSEEYDLKMTEEEYHQSVKDLATALEISQSERKTHPPGTKEIEEELKRRFGNNY
jgi:hypothetical protein